MENSRIRTYLTKRGKVWYIKIYDRVTKEVQFKSTGQTKKTDAQIWLRDYRRKFVDVEENIVSNEPIKDLPSLKQSNGVYIDDILFSMAFDGDIGRLMLLWEQEEDGEEVTSKIKKIMMLF